MVKPEVLRKRLNKLDEYIAILRTLQRYSYADFAANPQCYGSAERFLQLAIEALTDMGNHVIADDNLGNVNWHSDIPNILHSGGLITDEQRETWIRMIGFRNALVHDYVDIDRHVVYDVLQNRLDEIHAFRKVFANWL